jgi:hypothetical protein
MIYGESSLAEKREVTRSFTMSLFSSVEGRLKSHILRV